MRHRECLDILFAPSARGKIFIILATTPYSTIWSGWSIIDSVCDVDPLWQVALLVATKFPSPMDGHVQQGHYFTGV